MWSLLFALFGPLVDLALKLFDRGIDLLSELNLVQLIEDYLLKPPFEVTSLAFCYGQCTPRPGRAGIHDSLGWRSTRFPDL